MVGSIPRADPGGIRSVTIASTTSSVMAFHSLRRQHFKAFRSPYYAWGVYLDDELCGTTVFGNGIVRMLAGMLLHGGWDTPVENNIFVDGIYKQVPFSNMQPDKYPAIQKMPSASRPGSMSNNVVQCNIFCYSGGMRFSTAPVG